MGSTCGVLKWEKYFSNRTVNTTLKLRMGVEDIRIFDFNKKVLFHAPAHHPVTVVETERYAAMYAIKLKHPITKDPISAYVQEVFVAKPRPPGSKLSQQLAQTLPQTFLTEGTKNKIIYNGKEIEVATFKTVDQLQKSILAGIIEPNVKKAFYHFFNRKYKNLKWPKNIHRETRARYGVVLGELLPGLFSLAGIPLPGLPKAKAFHVPTDCRFSGVDSMIESRGKKLVAISNKFGVGGGASMFSNLVPLGVANLENLQPSVFKELCSLSKELGPSKTMELVWQFALRKLLNIYDIQYPMVMYKAINNNFLVNKEVIRVTEAIQNWPNLHPRIAENLPYSFTAFFCREIANLLKTDPVSCDQIINILATKDYWQASLHREKWQKGEVSFKMTHTKKVKVDIVGRKCSYRDLRASGGTICYELKAV